MPEIIDPEQSQEWRDELQRKLSSALENGQKDLTVEYRPISIAFPGDPHPDYFVIKYIDWKPFTSWALALGWNVSPAPEITHPDQQSTPFIRFKHISLS